jgi:hypothetical protein
MIGMFGRLNRRSSILGALALVLMASCAQSPTAPEVGSDLVVLIIVQKGAGYDTVLIDTTADTLAHHRSAYLQPTDAK